MTKNQFRGGGDLENHYSRLCLHIDPEILIRSHINWNSMAFQIDIPIKTLLLQVNYQF